MIGIDISTFQGDVNFDVLKNSSDFVIIRSSYGNGYVDSKFSRNRDEARRVNIPRGYYHYAYPQYNTPEAEADWCAQVLIDLKPGEIVALDCEEPSFNGDWPAWARRFLDRFSNHLNGYKGLVYTNLNFMYKYDWHPLVEGNYGLWLALWNYSPDAALPVTDWPVVAMRQYTDQANVNGVSSPVDANVFYGDLDTFYKYGYQPNITKPKTMEDYLNFMLDQLLKLTRADYEDIKKYGISEWWNDHGDSEMRTALVENKQTPRLDVTDLNKTSEQLKTWVCFYSLHEYDNPWVDWLARGEINVKLQNSENQITDLNNKITDLTNQVLALQDALKKEREDLGKCTTALQNLQKEYDSYRNSVRPENWITALIKRLFGNKSE